MRTLIYNLFELSLFVIVTRALLNAPETVFVSGRNLVTKFDTIALKPKLSIAVAGVIAFVGSAFVSFLFGIPAPRFHDEFSNLLAAETFAGGRITNPPHPMWIHFETFHVIHQPTYMSKYPPAQGLILAAGKMIGGHPIVGVWASVGLASAALCWMLQAWVPKRWAFFGVVLFFLQVRFYLFPYSPGAFLGYWSQSYWGGSVAVLGGALLFGALPRIVRDTKFFDSLMLALGLVILANSRPFEGLVASIAAAIALPCLMNCRMHRWGHNLGGRFFLPVFIVLVPAVFAIGWYNFRVTGNAFQFPYLLHTKTYMAAPFFFFQNRLPATTYNHELIRDFHTGWELDPYLWHQTPWGLLGEMGEKITTLWQFYLGPTLTIPFLAMIPYFWRDRRLRFSIMTCGLAIAVFLLANWIFPHHAAPITALVLLITVQSLRQMHTWTFRGKAIGRRLVFAVPIVLTMSLTWLLILKSSFSSEEWSRLRMRIITQLNDLPGQHLVVVRYVGNDRNYRNYFEWVYNEPDIDNAKIVWAREMNSVRDRQLLNYYRSRKVWLLIHNDNQTLRLVPHPESTAYDVPAKSKDP